MNRLQSKKGETENGFLYSQYFSYAARWALPFTGKVKVHLWGRMSKSFIKTQQSYEIKWKAPIILG